MSFVKRHAAVLAVAVSCLGLGAGASAIASRRGQHDVDSQRGARGQSGRAQGWQRELRRAVHGELVIHTKKGFVDRHASTAASSSRCSGDVADPARGDQEGDLQDGHADHPVGRPRAQQRPALDAVER